MPTSQDKKLDQALQDMLDREAARRHTHSVLIGVQSGDRQISFEGAAGHATADQPFFMASITKMFAATVLMQLVDERRIKLDDRVASHLPHVDLFGVHVVGGTDYADYLTLRHLLHQTSGLADYYEGGVADDVKQNRDHRYDLDDVLAASRNLKPMAAPDSGKSHYSDTNFQLLGAVIETVTQTDLQSAFSARIFEPAGMVDTFIFDHATSHEHPQPVPLSNRDQRLDVPLIMSSMGADGGGVWTLTDGLRFLRAFFGGALFDASNLALMTPWNDLFFPFQYGYGLMRYKLPRWTNLFRETPEFIGHSGASGTWAFYAPMEDIFFVGAFNQLDAPQRAMRFMPRVIDLIRGHSGA